MNKDTLIKRFRLRMGDFPVKGKDTHGNEITFPHIFSDSEVTDLLEMSMATLNGFMPTTRQIVWDEDAIRPYTDIIIHGAVVTALASRSLIERGREFTMTDTGISFTPPNMSDVLMLQWSTECHLYNEKLKDIRSYRS